MSFPILEVAIEFASAAHKGQYRDGTGALPYITHPLEVLGLLRYVGDVQVESLLCAAVLHDVLEETDVTSELLLETFGPQIQQLVLELTREELQKSAADLLSPEELYSVRSGMLLDGISRMSDEAKAVKLADRLSNLRQAKVTRSKSKIARYKRQTEAILQLIEKNINPQLWKAISQEL